jgi:hypothetical protein
MYEVSTETGRRTGLTLDEAAAVLASERARQVLWLAGSYRRPLRSEERHELDAAVRFVRRLRSGDLGYPRVPVG